MAPRVKSKLHGKQLRDSFLSALLTNSTFEDFLCVPSQTQHLSTSLSLSSPRLRLHVRTLPILRTRLQCVSPSKPFPVTISTPRGGEAPPHCVPKLRSQTIVRVAIKVVVYIPCSPDTIHLRQCLAYSIQDEHGTGTVAEPRSHLWKALSVLTGQNTRSTSYETYSQTCSYLHTRINNMRRKSGSRLWKETVYLPWNQ